MRLLAGFFAASVICFAQIGTSTITGRVTDGSGAVVPGVNVSIVQRGTNFTNNAVTNTEGIYRVPSLQPGVYQVNFEAAGFKKTVRDGVELRTGDTLAVDAAMQVGQVTESIEVEGTSPLLQTETSSTGTVMTGNVLYEMPLYQRYVNATMNLVPGMSSGGFAYGGSLGSYHLAGQRNGAIGIFEDGVAGSNPQGGTETIKPLQNAVAEVNVISTLPPAEYGHSAGGVISVVKKSGTNDLHGMASWFGRTRNMQHRRYFDGARASDPKPGRPNGLPVFFMQPDANIGGPVVIPKLYDGRNKTFFFFGYQRLHEKKVAQIVTSTPTAEMRQGLFNFPGANPIFDPATTAQNPDGTWTRTPFAGNRIPLSRIDPVARKILDLDPWVYPNQPGTFTNTGPNANLLADEFARVFFNDYNLRIDQQFSTAFKIYGSYTQNDLSGWGRPIRIKEDLSFFDAAQGNYSPTRVLNSSLGYTWVASPSLVNDSRIGYFRRSGRTDVPTFGQDWPGQLGIPNVDSALMPSFGSQNGVYNLHGATPSKNVNETVSFRNDTTWVKNSHAFKFGYEILRFRLNSANFARFSEFDFGGVTAGLQPNGLGVPNTGIEFAGFLTGYVGQATFNSELTSWLPRSSIHSFYIQDDWKITPTLTANIGLRYSNESQFNTKYGAMTNFDPTVVDDLTGRMGAFIHPTDGLAARDNNNFNPRVGLSWHPFEKWVFRGGIGMYTVDIKFPQNRGQFEEYTSTAVQQRAPGDPRPLYQISRGPDPVQFPIRPDGTSPYVGANFNSRNSEWWDPNLRNPYTLNFNGSAQYEFKRNYLLDLSYQGSSGVGLVERWEFNTFPIDYFAGNPTQQNAVRAAAQNFRPFPHFGSIRYRSNFGHSTFHSGTVKLEKRMSQGLYFSTFYTYAKAINSQDGDNDGGGVAPIQNRGLEKARAGFDRTHRYIGVVNYELPFGQGKQWASSGWKKWIFGGFELSYIQTLESGNPLNFSYAGSPYNYYPGFAGSARPDVVSQIGIRDGWNDVGPNRFNTGASNSVYAGENNGLSHFTLPGGCGTVTSIPAGSDRTQCDYRIGNAGRNIGKGLPLRWSQISAQKNFRFSERYNAQLRWERSADTFVELDESFLLSMLPLTLAIVLVLAIACANVANLFMARAASRTHEISVRLSLGASRSRVIRQLLTECALVALLGGCGGLLLAHMTVNAVYPWAMAQMPLHFQQTFALDLQPDFRVFVYTLVVSLMTTVLFGLVPALECSRWNLTGALRDKGANAGQQRSQTRARNALLVAQVAVSMVLLIAAGLLVRSLSRLRLIDTGLSPNGVVSTAVLLEGSTRDFSREAELRRRLADRLQEVRGMSIAHAWRPPFTGRIETTQVLPLDSPRTTAPVSVNYNLVAGDFFATLRLRLIGGRLPTAQELASAQPVGVISERTARQFWPGQSPIGRTIRVGSAASATGVVPFFEVIGVVADTRSGLIWNPDATFVYLPLSNRDSRPAHLMIRAESERAAMEALRTEAGALGAHFQLIAIPMRTGLEYQMKPFEVSALVAFILGGLALLLAGVGLYGVISYLVNQRVPEIGIRLALGATRGSVIRMVVLQAGRLVGLGLVVGTLGGLAATRLLASVLAVAGLSPLDPVAWVSVATLFVVVTAAATCAPAWRASRVDPMVAVRYE